MEQVKTDFNDSPINVVLEQMIKAVRSGTSKFTAAADNGTIINCSRW